MQEKIARYQQAGIKAVEFQLSYQLPDGGYIWDGYADDAYHKQPYAWGITGFVTQAHRLLSWVKHNTLQPDGMLQAYKGDVYKHAWFFQGAHRLGRFDLSYPVMSALAALQAPCGGFPHFPGEPYLRVLPTCWAGIAAIYAGRLELAERTARWTMSVLEQQRDPGRFYYRTTTSGKLITTDSDPAALFIDTAKPKQVYWELGLPLQLMCRLYQATGEARYLELATRCFELHLTCFEDAFTFTGSGKSSLGAAQFYLLTGDQRAREAAYRFCDFLVATQYPEGGWRDETTMPDILLIYIDAAAEFTVWLNETSAALAAGEAQWGGG